MIFKKSKTVQLFLLPLFLAGLLSVGCSNANNQASDSVPNKAVEAAEKPLTKGEPGVVVQPQVKIQPVNGAKVYNRCAACHMKAGEGVVGAFPPLKGEIVQLLNSDLGKEYLVLVTMYGLAGEIMVDGESYSGMMTAQVGMTPEKTAAVLNHVMQTFNSVSEADPRLFTANFVTKTKAKHGRLSGSKVYALRAAAYESVLP